MKECFRFLLIFNIAGLLLACSDKTEESMVPPDHPSQATIEKRTETKSPQINSNDLSILLLPEQPTSSDCLQPIVSGRVVRTGFRWFVNGEEVPGQTGNKLCNEFFKRDDEIKVELKRGEGEGGAIVIIGNSPPGITNVTATSEEALHHGDITVTAVGDDPDGDEVKFQYQWLINGEEDPFSVDGTLPGENYRRGDRIQVRITPNDGFNDGRAYESAILTIPNAPPQISSPPPQQFESLEFTYQVEASDPDDTELMFRLDSAPDGMVISDTGLITWSLSAMAPGSYSIQVMVEDPQGATTRQDFTINLAKEPPKE